MTVILNMFAAQLLLTTAFLYDLQEFSSYSFGFLDWSNRMVILAAIYLMFTLYQLFG